MNDRKKKGPAYPPGQMRRLLAGPALFLIILLGVLIVAAGPAEAHAYLLRAEPPQNERVDDPPSEFVLRFSERLEPRHASVRVLDSDDHDYVTGIEVDSETQREVTVALEPLEDERLYTVRWEVLSTVDGHTTSGGYILAVGMDIPEDAELLGADPVQDVRFWETLARALAYAGASLLAGIPAYLLYRFRFVPIKGLLQRPVVEQQTRETFLLLLAGWGGILSALAVISLIIGLALRINVGWVDAVTTTFSGQLLAIRAALLLTGCAFAFQATRSTRRLVWTAAAFTAALGALLVTSLGAHAASADGATTVHITADFLHQVAAAAWISGVVAMLFTLPRAENAHTAGVLVRDFSPFAMGSVVVLVATGIYGSLVHIDDPWAFSVPDTGWEIALVIKILLIIPLVVLGAWNRYFLQPRLLAGDDNPSLPRIKRSVRIEILLMAVVLVATGALTHATPPSEIEEFTRPLPGQVFDYETDDGDLFEVGVQPEPITVGIQNLTIRMTPAEDIPDNIGVFITMHGPDGGETGPLRLQQLGDETRWYIRDTLFTQSGGWHIDVLVQGAGYYEEFDFIVIVES